MPLRVLTNTIWQDAASLIVTDTSYALTTDASGLEHVTAGQRWHKWTQSGTADRYISYVNKNGGLGCSHVVLTRADLHVGHQVQLISHSSYSGTATTEYNSGSSWAPTLIGRTSQDHVWTLACSSKQAMTLGLLAGTAGSYAKSVHQIYFSDALTLTYPQGVTRSQLRFPTTYTHKREAYLVDEQWDFSAVGLTRAEVETLQSLYRLQAAPCFIYDADGTLIPFKLLHGLMSNFQIVAYFDDGYAVQMTVLALREWV